MRIVYNTQISSKKGFILGKNVKNQLNQMKTT